MDTALITSPAGILSTLAGVAALFHFLERATRWRLFEFFPPLLFVYAVPVLLSGTGVIAHRSPVYDWMGEVILPMFLVLMLLEIDVAAAVRVLGRGILVMLCGTAGVIIGAPAALLVVKGRLGPETWKAFGALAGSWIGGTGNMAAVSQGLETPPADFGLAVLADALIYLIWLPILLGSRGLAGWFNRFARVDPTRIAMLERAADELPGKKEEMRMAHVLYLIFLGLSVPCLAARLALCLPELAPVLTTGSWKILLVTTFGLLLSLTPAKAIPGSRPLAAALVILFVANMGARVEVGALAGRAPWFLLGAVLWIVVHGACCVLGARLFRVDIHSTAIASAANIGGIASAPIVAAYHNERLVPASILMALIGYAIGNYGGFLAAWLCYLVA